MYQNKPVLYESSQYNIQLLQNAIDAIHAEYKVKLVNLERDQLVTLQTYKRDNRYLESDLFYKKRLDEIENEFYVKRNALNFDCHIRIKKYQHNIRFFQMEDQFMNGKEFYNEALDHLPFLKQQMNDFNKNRMYRCFVSFLSMICIGIVVYVCFDFSSTMNTTTMIYLSINGFVYFCCLVCITSSNGHNECHACEKSFYVHKPWSQYFLLLLCGLIFPLFCILFLHWALYNPYSNDVKRYETFVKWFLKAEKQVVQGIDLFESNSPSESDSNSDGELESEHSSLV